MIRSKDSPLTPGDAVNDTLGNTVGDSIGDALGDEVGDSEALTIVAFALTVWTARAIAVPLAALSALSSTCPQAVNNIIDSMTVNSDRIINRL